MRINDSKWIISTLIICLVLFGYAIYSQNSVHPEMSKSKIVKQNSETSDASILMDFTQLHLEITNTEIVDQVSGKQYSYDGLLVKDRDATLTSSAGKKFFVVTLKGIVSSEPCTIQIGHNDFTAIYAITSYSYRVAVSSAISLDGGEWLIPSEERVTSSVSFIEEPRSLAIKIAFDLPQETIDFLVRYPALVRGKTTILPSRKP